MGWMRSFYSFFLSLTFCHLHVNWLSGQQLLYFLFWRRCQKIYCFHPRKDVLLKENFQLLANLSAFCIGFCCILGLRLNSIYLVLLFLSHFDLIDFFAISVNPVHCTTWILSGCIWIGPFVTFLFGNDNDLNFGEQKCAVGQKCE